MAAFVKSVERLQVSGTGPGPITATANLTKNQDLSKTVAFCTARAATSISDAVAAYMHAVRVFDDAGTKKVEVSKVHNGSTDFVAETMVVEFGSNVTVQKGGLLRLSGLSVTQAITSVNQTNSFIVFSHRADTGNLGDDWNDALVQARFNSNTEIQFERLASGPPDIDIYWAVVESNGTDFQTEYVEFSTTSNDTRLTQTLSNTVDLDHSFIVPSYKTSENSDDVRDAISNMALTGPTTLDWYRNHGSTPSATNNIGCWVIRSNSAGLTTQRLATDVNSGTTNNQTITSVNLDKAAIFNGGNIGMGAFPISNSTAGYIGGDTMSTLALTSTTNVQIVRRFTGDVPGSNNFIRYEVVEFELESAGPGPQVIPVGQVEETDTALEVKPVPGAVSVPVGLVVETDEALTVTPIVGGGPQTVVVEAVGETDEAFEVTVVPGAVNVAVGLSEETDEAFEAKVVPGAISVSVGQVDETDVVAPVMPVQEGGPQTVIVINVAEIDTVFAVTPRLSTLEGRNQEEDFFIGVRIGI